MESTRVLEDGLGEGLALDGGDLELLGAGLARAVTAGEGTGTPGASTVDLGQVSELGERLGVAEGNVDDAVVGERGQSSDGSRLLTTTQGAGGDEDTTELAVEATSSPLSASAVPESL